MPPVSQLSLQHAGCYLCIIIVGAGCLIGGVYWLQSTNEYNSATAESCIITDVDIRLADTGKGCYNKALYDYEAIAEDKCGNQTLEYEGAYDTCTEDPKYETNETATCYIIDCDRKFLLDSPGTDGAGVTVLPWIFIIVTICCMCGLCIYLIMETKDNNEYLCWRKETKKSTYSYNL